MSAQQAKERLQGLKRDFDESVFDLALKINELVKVAYPFTPVAEREQLAIDYLTGSMHNPYSRRTP